MAVEGITSTTEIGVHVDDDGTPQVFETPGGRGQPAEVEVTYIARWADRFGIYRELLGGFAQLNGLGVPLPGHAYPQSPNLGCESIGRVQPYGIDKAKLRANAGDMPESLAVRRWEWPKWCLIPAVYRPMDYAYSIETANEANQLDPDDPIIGCRQRVEANNSYIVVDNATMELRDGRYDPAEVPDSHVPPRVLQSTDGIPANSVAFTLEYPRVPRNPYGFLLPYLGKVNLFRMWGLPPGHVLFAGLALDFASSFQGTELGCTLTYLGNLDVAWNETIDDDGVIKAKTFVRGGVNAPYPFQAADLMLALR